MVLVIVCNYPHVRDTGNKVTSEPNAQSSKRKKQKFLKKEVNSWTL